MITSHCVSALSPCGIRVVKVFLVLQPPYSQSCSCCELHRGGKTFRQRTAGDQGLAQFIKLIWQLSTILASCELRDPAMLPQSAARASDGDCPALGTSQFHFDASLDKFRPSYVSASFPFCLPCPSSFDSFSSHPSRPASISSLIRQRVCKFQELAIKTTLRAQSLWS